MDLAVLRNFEVSLNSFGCETTAGLAIATPAAVPEPLSALLIGAAGLAFILFSWTSRFARQTRTVVMLATATVASSVALSAQTPVDSDPTGGYYAQFRSDHLLSVVPPSIADPSIPS